MRDCDWGFGLCMQYFVDSGQVSVSAHGQEFGKVGEEEFVGEAFLATLRSLLLEIVTDPALKDQLQAVGPQAFYILRSTKVQASGPCRCLELSVKDILAVFKDDHAGLAAAFRYRGLRGVHCEYFG